MSGYLPRYANVTTDILDTIISESIEQAILMPPADLSAQATEGMSNLDEIREDFRSRKLDEKERAADTSSMYE